MKKYLALLLVLVMALGLFAGCNNTDTPDPSTNTGANTPSQNDTNSSEDKPEPKDPVTLYWYTYGPGVQTNTDHVNEEFNKLLQTYEGFEHLSIKFMPCGDDINTIVTNAYAAEQQIDIVCTVGLNAVDYARDGYFIALDDLLAEHQDLWNELPEWLWMTQYIDDGIYTVPNYQRGNNPAVFQMRAKYADLCDWEGLCDLISWHGGRASKGTVEEICAKMEECLLDVRKATGRNDIYFERMNALQGLMTKVEYLDGGAWDQASSAYARPFDKDITVTMPYFDEEFLTLWKIACEWKDKGYFPADIIGAEPGTYSFVNDSFLFQSSFTRTLDEEKASELTSGQIGEEVLSCIPHGFAYMENRWGAGGQAISATCENPEDAIAFLELIDTEKGKDLFNMLVFGIEGEDWEWEDKANNRIKTLYYDGPQAGSEAPYSAHMWAVGNTFNAYKNQGYTDWEIEHALEINNTAEGCPWAGVQLDTSDVANNVSNMKALCAEVLDRIRWGVDGVAGYEAAVKEIQDKANAAGAQEIIKSLQDQLDAYMAGK